MDEKLVVVSIDNEIVDVADNFNPIDLCHYLIRNGLKKLDILEFEAFVYVICEWK